MASISSICVAPPPVAVKCSSAFSDRTPILTPVSVTDVSESEAESLNFDYSLDAKAHVARKPVRPRRKGTHAKASGENPRSKLLSGNGLNRRRTNGNKKRSSSKRSGRVRLVQNRVKASRIHAQSQRYYSMVSSLPAFLPAVEPFRSVKILK